MLLKNGDSDDQGKNKSCALNGIDKAQFAFVEDKNPESGSKGVNHQAGDDIRTEKKTQELPQTVDVLAGCPQFPEGLPGHHENGVKNRQQD